MNPEPAGERIFRYDDLRPPASQLPSPGRGQDRSTFHAAGFEKTDHPAIVVQLNGRFGRGLLAVDNLPKKEIIARFDGLIYTARLASELPNDPPLFVRDHAVQFSETQYRLSRYGTLINHSCDPNCGVIQLGDCFGLVTMRPVARGEELTYDYEMSEDSDWRMECLCGSPVCRKVIGAYRNMPENIRKKYEGYVAQYLIRKYGEPV